MKIIHNTAILPKDQPIVATMGMFDGVHLGHQKLLKTLSETAKKVGGKSLLISFNPHPRIVLYQDESIRLLSLSDEKIELLQNTGIDYYIALEFTPEFSNLTAYEFVRDVLVSQFNVQYLLVGHDHQFGKNREGNFEQLQEYSEIFDFTIEKLPAVIIGENAISSTKIRRALQEGSIEKANEMLGYSYSIKGIVVEGKKLGASLGFPTANLKVDKYKLIPREGVYIGEAMVHHQTYPAMINIGFQPTLKGKSLQIEAHLLHFDEDIYGEEMKLFFYKFLRNETPFPTKEDLKMQLQKDLRATQDFFKTN